MPYNDNKCHEAAEADGMHLDYGRAGKQSFDWGWLLIAAILLSLCIGGILVVIAGLLYLCESIMERPAYYRREDIITAMIMAILGCTVTVFCGRWCWLAVWKSRR
jgi:hypothetical protein